MRRKELEQLVMDLERIVTEQSKESKEMAKKLELLANMLVIKEALKDKDKPMTNQEMVEEWMYGERKKK
jgi:uncharacterized coiled-coil protein SlyX